MTSKHTIFRNWRGTLKSRECPPNSGHHVVYTSLPKNTDIQYKWMLLGNDNRSVKEKELQRVITLGSDDLTVQDVFGVYTSLLPQIFQPGELSFLDCIASGLNYRPIRR